MANVFAQAGELNMGLFDFLSRKKQPTDLRTSLIQAVARRDQKTFGILCEQNQKEIRDSFASWRKLPDEFLKDKSAQQKYVEMLFTVAQSFEQAGYLELMTLLTGNEDDNPILGWQNELEVANSLLEAGSFQACAQKLDELLKSMEGNSGTGVDKYRSMAVGTLAIARFRLGELDLARQLTQRALDLCKANEDDEGVQTYSQNLRLMYDGTIVIYKDSGGRELSNADLLRTTGTVRFELLGHDKISHQAQSLHQQGREAGGAGDYPRALAVLQQAMALEPQWPAPAYDIAFTYLLMKDYHQALQYYRKVVQLAPRGYFTALTAVHTLEREQAGELPDGTYLSFAMLEWVDNETRTNIVRQMVDKLPSFAPAWKELALLEDSPAQRQATLERALNADPDIETLGIVKLNQALMLNEQGKKSEAVEMLSALALDPNSSMTTANLAKETLANFI